MMAQAFISLGAFPAGNPSVSFTVSLCSAGCYRPQDRLAFLEGPVHQGVPVQIEKVEDHVAQVPRQLTVPRSEPLLESLEVRLAFVVDRDDLAVQQERCQEASEGIGHRPKQVGERMTVARD